MYLNVKACIMLPCKVAQSNEIGHCKNPHVHPSHERSMRIAASQNDKIVPAPQEITRDNVLEQTIPQLLQYIQMAKASKQISSAILLAPSQIRLHSIQNGPLLRVTRNTFRARSYGCAVHSALGEQY